MLTKFTISNFKCLKEAEFDLANTVVFIGPNNSGKTSAMQALTLWDTAARHWHTSSAKSKAKASRSITISRRDLLAIPHPRTSHLWHDLRVRQAQENIRIELTAEGVHPANGKNWKCGFQFTYANPENFYCRPLAGSHDSSFLKQDKDLHMAILPPMSGLAANETRIEPGAINVRLGEGRTAEVLRNICFDICQQQNGNWDSLVEHIDELFGVRIEQPSHVAARGEIAMEYRQHDSKARFDLSASGRGLQQTLLILAFLYSRPAGSIVLLDEPDAHLEILRQRQIYNTIKNVADANKSQIVIASHSEVLLRESFEDTVIAFVGKPHRISLSRQSEVRKSLETIGFDQYYLAKQTGWVLYLEGPTDLAILQSFAKRLEKSDASAALARPFVKYVGNNLDEIRKHFFGLREALPGLRGVAVLDRINPPAKQHENGLKFNFWKKREIENYLCSEKTLQRYVQETTDEEQLGALFYQGERAKRLNAMNQAIASVIAARKTLKSLPAWGDDIKASDDFLTPVFQNYFEILGTTVLVKKSDFYQLVDCMSREEIDPEIGEKLDAISKVAKSCPSLPATAGSE